MHLWKCWTNCPFSHPPSLVEICGARSGVVIDWLGYYALEGEVEMGWGECGWLICRVMCCEGGTLWAGERWRRGSRWNRGIRGWFGWNSLGEKNSAEVV